MASIDIRDVSKTFGQTVALAGVDLSIADREFLVLLGPSGCGKTTLLNIVAGLETESSGEVRIGDRRATGLSPAERDLGFVFQNYALYPNKTVFQNLAFALQFRRADAPEFSEYTLEDRRIPKRELIDLRVRDIAQVLQIESLLNRHPAQLSGGQRQRVAMGRALVRKPNAYLFDEPLSNLDAVLRVTVRQEIKEIHRRFQSTMVYVTHDQIEAMSLADRIAVLNEGRVLQIGTPEEIYERPATTFVARFIGSPPMNIVPGRIARDERSLELRFEGGRLGVPPIVEERYRSFIERPVYFGIRPEHIALVDRFPLAAKSRATVLGTEFLGGGTLLHVSLGEQRLILAGASHGTLQRGDSVEVFLDMTRFQLFDAEDGRALAAH